MTTPVRVTAITMIGIALLAACGPAATSMPTSVQTPTGLAVTRAPEPSPSSSNLVTGAVKSARFFSGRVGTTVDVTVDFSASSASGEVREMRVKASLAPNGWLSGMTQCYSEAELSQVAWEPFVAHKNYAVSIPPLPTNTPFDPYNLGFAFYAVSVQYRDSAGNVSALYCVSDKIGKLP